MPICGLKWADCGKDMVIQMFQVIKRNGELADFTLVKIEDAIMKAFYATDMQYTKDIVDLLALRVTAEFQDKVKDGQIHVEDIQDSVEKVLSRPGMRSRQKHLSYTASSGKRCVI